MTPPNDWFWLFDLICLLHSGSHSQRHRQPPRSLLTQTTKRGSLRRERDKLYKHHYENATRTTTRSTTRTTMRNTTKITTRNTARTATRTTTKTLRKSLREALRESLREALLIPVALVALVALVTLVAQTLVAYGFRGSDSWLRLLWLVTLVA